MEEPNLSLIKVNLSLLEALSKKGISINVMPKDILVLECIVAGTSFRNVKNIEPSLGTEVKLTIKREGENDFDKFAIAIYFENNKIGYIPRDKNEVIARLMDSGKTFFASIQAKEWEGDWLKISIKVYLKD